MAFPQSSVPSHTTFPNHSHIIPIISNEAEPVTRIDKDSSVPHQADQSAVPAGLQDNLMDFQQSRLILLLADCYAYHFASLKLLKYFNLVNAWWEDRDISGLKSFHHISAGLKAFSTWWCNEGRRRIFSEISS